MRWRDGGTPQAPALPRRRPPAADGHTDSSAPLGLQRPGLQLRHRGSWNRFLKESLLMERLAGKLWAPAGEQTDLETQLACPSVNCPPLCLSRPPFSPTPRGQYENMLGSRRPSRLYLHMGPRELDRCAAGRTTLALTCCGKQTERHRAGRSPAPVRGAQRGPGSRSLPHAVSASSGPSPAGCRAQAKGSLKDEICCAPVKPPAEAAVSLRAGSFGFHRHDQLLASD